jgi:hypothetical protein
MQWDRWSACVKSRIITRKYMHAETLALLTKAPFTRARVDFQPQVVIFLFCLHEPGLTTIFANPGQQFSTRADSSNMPSNRLEQSVFCIPYRAHTIIFLLVLPLLSFSIRLYLFLSGI